MQCASNKINPFMFTAERIKLITGAYTVNKGHKRNNKIMNKNISIPPIKKQIKLLKKLHSGTLKKFSNYETPVKYYFHSRKNI